MNRRIISRLHAGKLVLGLAIAGSAALAVAQYAPAEQTVEPNPAPGTIVRASQVMGQQVWDPHSQELGTIKDVVIDYQQDRPAVYFAIAPSVADGGSGYILAPSHIARYHHDARRGNYFVLNLGVDQFRRAPRIEGNRWEVIQRRDFMDRAGDFYRRIERSAAKPTTPSFGESRPDAERRPSGYQDRPGARTDAPRDAERGARERRDNQYRDRQERDNRAATPRGQRDAEPRQRTERRSQDDTSGRKSQDSQSSQPDQRDRDSATENR